MGNKNTLSHIAVQYNTEPKLINIGKTAPWQSNIDCKPLKSQVELGGQAYGDEAFANCELISTQWVS